MKAKARRISTRKDNVTWCRPSEGYGTNAEIEVEADHYVEVATVKGELPESDEKWPRGAPTLDYVKVGDKILKRKMP
jgi:hypothetical protein